jgi:16S rRNA (cytosine967-C5)-methyltransferase
MRSPPAIAVNARILGIVESVLRHSSREKPADNVLRAELRRQSGLPVEDAASVARAVFAWFRWRTWLDESKALSAQVQDALEYQDRFNANPDAFSDEELLQRGVPSWVSGLMDVTPAWVRALQAEPPLWLRAKPGQGRKLAAKLGECWIPESPALADSVQYHGHEDLFRAPEFHAGEFEVQDVSSQIVGLVCAPRPGETWWDACAGEGGKTLHLSAMMENKGLIWASDRASWRLKRLKLRAARAKAFNYRARLWDGSAQPPVKTKFDGVLLDAPCSGLGTWQRNPHARWTTQPQDVEELAALQTQLLRHISGSVKPGGRIIYAVCTLTRSETTDVAAAFEKEFGQFKRTLLLNPFKANESPKSSLWLWPQDGGNGMFVSAWQREKG